MRSSWPDLVARRVAVDRAKLLIQAPLALARWGELLEQDALVFATPDGTITAQRRGRRDPEAQSLIFDASDQGAWLHVRHPSHVDEKRGQFHVELEAQGLLCSTAATGLPAVNGLRELVVGELYGAGAADDVDALTFAGKTDIAVDVEWCAPPARASAAIEELIYARGHQDEALARFSTRARKRKRKTMAQYGTTGAAMVGSGATGRTIYWGANPTNVLYEKDREAGRDWPVVAERLREAGWNGEHRITRYEVRFNREFFHNNSVELAGGAKVKLATLPFDAFVPHLPTLLGAALARFRHTSGDATRAKRSHDSPLWRELARRTVAWHEELCGPDPWKGAGAIKTLQRAATLERATKQLERALVRMQLFAPGSGLPDVAVAASEAIVRGESVCGPDELLELQKRTARKLDLAVPATWRRAPPATPAPCAHDAPAASCPTCRRPL